MKIYTTPEGKVLGIYFSDEGLLRFMNSPKFREMIEEELKQESLRYECPENNKPNLKEE